MSETDDTEILLLIPPDFFLVRSSDSDESLLESSRTVVHKSPCTTRVLEKLVNQVHSINTRLDTLELNTSANLSSRENLGSKNKTWDFCESVDRSLDRKCNTFPRRRRRKAGPQRRKKRDLSLTSLDSSSTCNKNIPPLFIKEISQIPCGSTKLDRSMDGDISSIVSSPNKKNDKLLLHEIDDFLNKVESYESPESKFASSRPLLNSDNVIRATSDYISRQLDDGNSGDDIQLPSGRTISNAVLDKYIYLTKNNSSLQNDKKCKDSYKNDVTEPPKMDSVPKIPLEPPKHTIDVRTPIARQLNFLDINKEVQPTSTPKQIPPNTYADSFRPSTNKIYDRASKVLEQYKAGYSRYPDYSVDTSYLNSPKKDYKANKPSATERHRSNVILNKYAESIDTDLLSLSELWGEKGGRGDSGRLEEERLKREHCEAMIQDLQKKVLEQQEKLAVAVKVDRAKDAAIGKLREAWLRMTGSLDRAEARHKATLDKITAEVDNYKHLLDEAKKKQQHFETELYKTLDLAHDYQEKCKILTSEKKHLLDSLDKVKAENQDIIKNKDHEIETMKESYEAVMRLNKQSTECIKNLEDNIEKERSQHDVTKTKLSEMIKKSQTAADEMTLVNQEKDLLKEKVNEERSRSTLLQKQLSEKLCQLSDAQKRENMLDNEVKSLHKHLEHQKNELKCHYQKQLEDAVLSKLQEFQQQLDTAEKHMANETKAKENAIVDVYNKQMARIDEQHRLEVSVLEEKQKEEIKLYRLQLAQASEKIGLLEGKLDSYRRRRGEIAGQLHAVMQSQWRQALRILTGGGGGHTPLPPSAQDTSADTAPHGVSTPIAQDYGPPKVPPLSMASFAERTLSSSRELSQHSASLPHGLSAQDRMFNFEGLSDGELQQYVKLLLTKPPMFLDGLSPPQDGLQSKAQTKPDELKEEPTSDRPDQKKSAKRSLNSSKPPWKA